MLKAIVGWFNRLDKIIWKRLICEAKIEAAEIENLEMLKNAYVSQQGKENVLTLFDSSEIGESAYSILDDFLSDIILVYEQQKEKDDTINQLITICNKYLLDKQLRHNKSLRNCILASIGNAPVFEQNLASGIGCHIRLMGDHDNGNASLLIKSGEQFHDFLTPCRIQISRRFVCQQDFGLANNGPGNCHSLLLSPGKLSGGMGFPSFETHRFQSRHRVFPAFMGRNSPVDQRQLNIFQRRSPVQQIEPLKNKAQIMPAEHSPLITGQIPHLNPFKQIAPRTGTVQTAQNIHTRGFA
jgi:hypothetical protein